LNAVINGDLDAVSIMMVDSKATSAEVSVNDFLEQDGIITVKKSNSISGFVAYDAEATGQTENGIQLKFYLYVIEYNGLIYRFLNYATEGTYEIYGSRFKTMTDGFRELIDSGILNIHQKSTQVAKTSRQTDLMNPYPI